MTWYNGGHDGGCPGHRDPQPGSTSGSSTSSAAPGRCRPPPSGTPWTGRSATPAGPAAAPWRRPTYPGLAGDGATTARRDRSRRRSTVRRQPARRGAGRDLHAPGVVRDCVDGDRHVPRRPSGTDGALHVGARERAHRPRGHAAHHRGRRPHPGARGLRAAQRPRPTTEPCFSPRSPRSARAATGHWRAEPSRPSASPTFPPTAAAVPVTINLPASALQLEPGATLEVNVSTTDQAFAGSTAPAAYRIALADEAVQGIAPGAVSAPEVRRRAGVRVGHPDLPARRPDRARRARHARPALRRHGPLAAFATSTPTLSTSRSPSRASASPIPGGVHAVTDVSFRVEQGQVLGLLGPNGAGKTTTLRMVMGLIFPTAGRDPRVRPSGPAGIADPVPHRQLRRGIRLPASPVRQGEPGAVLEGDRPSHAGRAHRRRPCRSPRWARR